MEINDGHDRNLLLLLLLPFFFFSVLEKITRKKKITGIIRISSRFREINVEKVTSKKQETHGLL